MRIKQIEKINKEYKHYVMQEIGLIKGYKLINETTENEGIIINHIIMEMNLESETGRQLLEDVSDKFKPEQLKPKYVNSANYIYSETEFDGIRRIEIKILTNRKNPKEVVAKRKLLQKINKYT